MRDTHWKSYKNGFLSNMKVYRTIDEISFREDSILTLGTFDGIHLGHQKIIEKLVYEARQKKARSVLVTFYPHPQTVVNSRRERIELLTPLNEKVEILENTGLDVVIFIPFTRELANTEPEVFIEDLLLKHVGIRKFVIGYNHAFGRGRRGEEKLFQELGKRLDFSVEVISPVMMDGESISSTRIRTLLKEGNVRRANRLLGWNYSLYGLVKKGEKLGEKIGFPTANVDVLGENKLVPRDGVYAVIVKIEGEKLTGMANLGFKPTVQGKRRGLEVHIHEFEGDLYGKRLKIMFIQRLRDEKQFDSMDALVTQIELDQQKSMELLSKYIRR